MTDREAITIFALNNFGEDGPRASVETLRFFSVKAQVKALKALTKSNKVSDTATLMAREVLAALETL